MTILAGLPVEYLALVARLRRRAVAAAAVFVVVILVILRLSNQDAEPVAGHLRMAIDGTAASADFSETAVRQGYVILQEWEHERLRALKARNPDVTVLVYKNLSSMMSVDEQGHASTGITVEDAASHPDWFLLGPAGERLTFESFPWLFAADVGSPSYQRRWGDRVLATLREHPWDGVFADDANPTLRHHVDPARVTRYPTDAAYGEATGSALASIGPRIRGAGGLIIANFGSWSGYRPVADGWLDSVSGAMEEQFAKFGTSPDTGYVIGVDWERQLGAIEAAESRGRRFLGIAHSANTDAAAARYGWATMLLAANGNSAFALHGDYTNETWFPEYDLELGEPDGRRRRDPSGLYRRRFTDGLVLVNPTTSPLTAELGGRYSGSGLTRARRTVIAPHNGLVLVED